MVVLVVSGLWAVSWATQGPMKVGYMIWVIDKLSSATKGGGLRNSAHDMVNRMLVMNVMQVGSTTFAMLVHKKNLVV